MTPWTGSNVVPRVENGSHQASRACATLLYLGKYLYLLQFNQPGQDLRGVLPEYVSTYFENESLV